MKSEHLRASGDRELAARILADPQVKRLLEQREGDRFLQVRRHLLGTAVRLTASMAPGVHAVIERCRAALGAADPVETYVIPSPQYNAFSYGSADERIYVGVTAALLEAFADDELAFVVGHELGHFLFDHHDIPIGAIVQSRGNGLSPAQAIQLFQWQRYAEISADRAGLVCAGDLTSTARAFFKIASGLRGDRVAFDIDAYLEQIGDIQTEAAEARRREEKPRSDWFASHPFSPLRVRAAQLCARSEICEPGGTPVAELEAEVQQLMALMDPSYLVDQSPAGNAMRQLMFAGGVLVAASRGEISEPEVDALAGFLGEGKLPSRLNPDALRADLQRRIDNVIERVPPLARTAVIRDLCVVALADGHAQPAELEVIRDIAQRVEVDPAVVEQTVAAAERGLD